MEADMGEGGDTVETLGERIGEPDEGAQNAPRRMTPGAAPGATRSSREPPSAAFLLALAGGDFG
jgi:hypothetical protein